MAAVFPIKANCIVGPAGRDCSGDATPTGVTGSVEFEQPSDTEPTTITYNVTGLTPGLHGFHVHEKADFSNGCVSAGPHYNPFGKTHGGPDDEERHVGDLGNIEANGDGVAEGTMLDINIRLTGDYSVIGRSIMVHEGVDDLGKGGHELSPTTGNAGGRLACGEIKLI
mmetsp:Transcript_4349/g.4466  ORF Transcript_4349/g.4466 Transcript_4349/m.4466 type:complete len:168 (+) Transcript_4349:108-611(+)|eukprot:CAMPEP_0182427084 /NCGR_PEP_ID=MMETSP1167-20130531/14352_1 /TAXON_ID=2988 /ORGANISM="Mallomonas Sp, Strain CCMP3275" /LENGTH=167 /DNA_ID=CAMNT_0024608989 /DNA_START=73 /DNA_END=576 /DNA_ORIENTATION=+